MKVIHVLLVDDDPDILDLLGDVLRGEGLGVDTARSGEEALQKLESYHPELIIADVQMPGMSGFDLCRNLRETGRDDIPFFFCSTRGSLPERIEGLSLGADDYLVKPVSPEELLFRVRIQLEKNRKAREFKEQADDPNRTLSGKLDDIDIIQVLQLIEQGKPGSYELLIKGPDGREGRVWIESRRVRHAEIRKQVGQKALFRILQLEEGTFEVFPTSKPPEETLDEDISALLLDSLSQIDEFRLLYKAFERQGSLLFVKYSDELFKTRFESAMLEMMELVEQHHDLEKILDQSAQSDLITLRILIELMQIGFIGVKEKPREYGVTSQR